MSLIDGLVAVVGSLQATTAALGVAIGPKQTDGISSDAAPLSIAFFVGSKRPTAGVRERFDDGVQVIPPSVSVADKVFPTDVVAIAPRAPLESKANVPRERFRAGGPISNISGEMGTFGALVRMPPTAGIYALTNRHVAMGAGNLVFFPSPHSPGAVGAFVSMDRALVADEQFAGFLDRHRTFFDVDAALARVPEGAVDRFSSKTPYLGPPAGIYAPRMDSLESYVESVLNQQVTAYSWNSKLRRGHVSHVLYARQAAGGRTLLYSMVIEGRNGIEPSSSRDSGKLWMTQSKPHLAIGLHQASLRLGSAASRFAVATDFALLGQHLGLKLLSI